MRRHQEEVKRTRFSMSETDVSKEEYDDPAQYEIRIEGHLDDRWAERFDGLTLTREDNGVTLLTGPVVDQAALHGVLRAVRDLGVRLLSVTHLQPEPAEASDGRP
jgi:hypothetical protein